MGGNRLVSCERVHQWIENQGFDNAQEAKQYVHKDFPSYDSNPNLYDCIDSYDFEYEFIIDRRGQLHRRGKQSKVFATIGLDPQARTAVMEHLRGLR